jgi:hypothetical protein
MNRRLFINRTWKPTLFGIFVPKLLFAQRAPHRREMMANNPAAAGGGGGGSNATYDTSAISACGVGIATRVINITVASQSNRCLIVAAGAGDNVIADRTVDSVSSDVSGAFTLVGSASADDANFCRMEMWRLIAPATGAHVITVTYSGGATGAAVAGAISLYGVDQSTPIGTPTVVNGTVASTTPNGAVTLGSDDMLVAGLFTDSDSTLSWTIGTSRQVATGCASDTCFGLATNTGTGSISAQASTSNEKYALVVIPVNGAP